jgi:hypothetical protein
MTKRSDEDELLLGYHGAHGIDELHSMSYVRLCSELELSNSGTTRHMLLEAEKRRRDSINAAEPAKTKPNHTGQESSDPPNQGKSWHEKPLGNVALSVVAATLALLVAFLLSKHFGIAP